MIRKPVAAGQFYPGSKKELNLLIEALKPKPTRKSCAKGVILPHAGYSFSGRVAVATLAQIRAPQNIVMLGPNHSGQGRNFALTSAESWQTPYGKVKVNQKLSKKILDSGSWIEIDSLAHQSEHSLEVELPILQYFFKQFTIIPICCSLADCQTYQEVANQISQGIRNDLKDTLILVSTDLTHYEPDESARRKDRKAIEAIIELDAKKLLKEVDENNITMCGTAPVAIALFCLSKVRKAELILYQTSAEASGDYSSVVGYVGIVLR